jgi:endonuclease G
MRDLDAWLKALVANDHSLGEEVRQARERAAPASRPRGAVSDLSPASDQIALRTIVLRVGRPVLAVVDAAPDLTFTDSESEVWRSRLLAAGAKLRPATRAVGRIDVTGHPRLQYVGTGWLVDDDLVLTNRHVAREFSRSDGGRFSFARRLDAGTMAASVDFLEECGRADHLVFPIVQIVHIENDEGPDVAFLRVARTADHHRVAEPIPLSDRPPDREQQVATIGYPARDSRIPDAGLMDDVFGDVYDKKRLAPGQVTDVRADVLLHDCSTLGGNSGSVLIDLATGKAVGLHFAGRFLEANYAVPAHVVAERLDAVKRGTAGRPRPHDGSRPEPPVAPPPGPPAHGTPQPHEVLVEGVPEDYEGRKGYDAAFLGVDVPLPLVRNMDDVLTFAWKGTIEHELRYEHFSVVMSRSRRLCILSAANIDGTRPGRFKRPSWRLDPRIPKAQQIRDECYGNQPKFARGHMTRREDPIWGGKDEAALGNTDSMHVTNTVPQMQPFNAGIWLGLESYALDHAREDDMRISVVTGPFLRTDDPVRDGVLIPRSFWKVIAFIHDETGSLCATGYTMTQDAFLHEEEFVFGQHATSQVRVAAIEQSAGLSFGSLASHDPLRGDEEGVAGTLTDPSQIRFR